MDASDFQIQYGSIGVYIGATLGNAQAVQELWLFAFCFKGSANDEASEFKMYREEDVNEAKVNLSGTKDMEERRDACGWDHWFKRVNLRLNISQISAAHGPIKFPCLLSEKGILVNKDHEGCLIFKYPVSFEAGEMRNIKYIVFFHSKRTDAVVFQSTVQNSIENTALVALNTLARVTSLQTTKGCCLKHTSVLYLEGSHVRSMSNNGSLQFPYDPGGGLPLVETKFFSGKNFHPLKIATSSLNFYELLDLPTSEECYL